MIALIDNYDSFTYNLYQYILEIRSDVIVFRNDKINLEDIIELDPSHIVISPGPCTPLEAGISTEIIKELSRKKIIKDRRDHVSSVNNAQIRASYFLSLYLFHSIHRIVTVVESDRSRSRIKSAPLTNNRGLGALFFPVLSRSNSLIIRLI